MSGPGGLPLWLEVHVDDHVLGRDPARWPDAAALLQRLAAAAEEEGARLSFRIMEPFARGDRERLLAGLVQRGHEVGWHAHGRRVPEAVAALAAAGVPDAARIGTPGLVQARERGRESLLHTSARAGLRLITDRLELRHHAYQGWLAWEVSPGVVSLDVSVDPFCWGVLLRRGGRVEHGYGTMDWAALEARLRTREAERAPPGTLPYFGATLHEHNLCAPETLTPLPAALDGLRRFLGRFGPRVRPAGAVLDDAPPGAAPDPCRPPEARGPAPLAALSRLGRSARRRVEPRPHRPEVLGRPGLVDGWLSLPGRRVAFRRVGPADARFVLVTAHGGASGIEQGLSFLGLDDDAFAAAGGAVWFFARSEGVRTPGNPQHVADARALLQRALAEEKPTAWLTWSAGVVMALRATVGQPEESRVRAWFDCEGPCDRFSVVPPGHPEHELAFADVYDEAPWEGREAIRHIGAVSHLYHRVQAGNDHVHGPMTLHARRMVATARHGRFLTDPPILPGKLWEHGATVRDAVVRVMQGLPGTDT